MQTISPQEAVDKIRKWCVHYQTGSRSEPTWFVDTIVNEIMATLAEPSIDKKAYMDQVKRQVKMDLYVAQTPDPLLPDRDNDPLHKRKVEFYEELATRLRQIS